MGGARRRIQALLLGVAVVGTLIETVPRFVDLPGLEFADLQPVRAQSITLASSLTPTSPTSTSRGS